MSSDDPDTRSDGGHAGGAPSNAELAERTARLEQKIDHITGAVDRIENTLENEHDSLAEQVSQNTQRVNRFWSIYRFCLYMLPLLLGTGSVGYWTLF
jgi:hypothetical protein